MRFILVENVLLEGTRYDEQAAKILSDSGVFDEETSKKVIDALFREGIHAFNHAPNWLEKYLKGIARMIVEESKGSREATISFLEESPAIFDQYLTWVKESREKYGNELDKKFINSMHYKDVKDFLDKLQQERDEKSKDELSKMKFSKNNYSLVPINSFEEFNKLYGGRATGDGSSDKYAGGGGTAWCHTNSKAVYDTWTRGGNRFFVLQNNNWKNIPFNPETNKKMGGKDDYGNSLIAIVVGRNGNLKYATLRCNHVGVNSNADNQYNTYAELSRIAGFDVEKEVAKYIQPIEEIDPTSCFKVDDKGRLYWDTEMADEYDIDKSAIIKYTIPDSVTSIGRGAFEGCSGLTSITIPESVTSIGWSAFERCVRLTDIDYQGTRTQWYEIIKGFGWDRGTYDYTIHCTDGDINTI